VKVIGYNEHIVDIQLQNAELGCSMSMVVSLLVLCGVLALVGLIVAGIRSESKNGGEDTMKKVYV
jgi:hypothetical protein